MDLVLPKHLLSCVQSSGEDANGFCFLVLGKLNASKPPLAPWATLCSYTHTTLRFVTTKTVCVCVFVCVHVPIS